MRALFVLDQAQPRLQFVVVGDELGPFREQGGQVPDILEDAGALRLGKLPEGLGAAPLFELFKLLLLGGQVKDTLPEPSGGS